MLLPFLTFRLLRFCMFSLRKFPWRHEYFSDTELGLIVKSTFGAWAGVGSLWSFLDYTCTTVVARHPFYSMLVGKARRLSEVHTSHHGFLPVERVRDQVYERMRSSHAKSTSGKSTFMWSSPTSCCTFCRRLLIRYLFVEIHWLMLP